MARARANPHDRPVMLTGTSAKRVARAVAIVERGDRSTTGQAFPQMPSDSSDPARLCKTSSTWTKGTTATLDVWESGTPGSETKSTGETIVGAVNKFATVASGKFVMVAPAGNGTYYLIAAEC